MAKKRVFTSFDAEHDDDLRIMLVGQSKNPDTPFEMADWSVKEELSGDWEAKVRAKIKRCELVIAICGEHTNTASGVRKELKFAREESVPYFLLYGRSSKTCVKPAGANANDKMYKWTWDNLKGLVGGAR